MRWHPKYIAPISARECAAFPFGEFLPATLKNVPCSVDLCYRPYTQSQIPFQVDVESAGRDRDELFPCRHREEESPSRITGAVSADGFPPQMIYPIDLFIDKLLYF